MVDGSTLDVEADTVRLAGDFVAFYREGDQIAIQQIRRDIVDFVELDPTDWSRT